LLGEPGTAELFVLSSLRRLREPGLAALERDRRAILAMAGD
jgi:hypothetical protein